MEALLGGRDGQVHRSNDKVYRPRGFWSESVHVLLTHLKHEQFGGAPQAFGFDEQGNEILSYVSGEVYNYPLVGPIATTEALNSAAKQLRTYHDATTSLFHLNSFNELHWQLPTREPQEVICHGDYAPYNVVLQNDTVVGMIDFDTAHPAPRIWDVAYAVYCWAPFKTHPYDALGTITQQTSRARLFCDAYGLVRSARTQLVDQMIVRLQALVDFMHHEAANGNTAFIDNINDGHHLAYLADITYLKHHKREITEALI
ncbi:phosphotransferase [Thaumasiovibrio sp. DFM-14]|uniref:phosphotransferase n=1 Tax=Thaumasiovibrio sp. DFM-14 TaxID=3384792 RepID=UPI00399F12A2